MIMSLSEELKGNFNRGDLACGVSFVVRYALIWTSNRGSSLDKPGSFSAQSKISVTF
jgi:hypothetical protein